MSNGEWVVCPLEESEGFRFKGEFYSISGQTASVDAFNISLRRGVDTWVTISRDDLEFFGIEPVKFVKPKPMEFEGTVVQIRRRDTCTNIPGVGYRDAVFGIELPDTWVGKKVKVIEVLE